LTSEKKCSACQTGCDVCPLDGADSKKADSAKCTTCSAKYVLDAKAKCGACEGTCASCSETAKADKCTDCPTGSVLGSATSSHAGKCVANCTTKTDKNTCKTCKTGYVVVPSGLCWKKANNCNTYSAADDKKCTKCDEKFMIEAGACVGCDATCATCDKKASKTNCLTCLAENYIVDDGKGSKTCATMLEAKAKANTIAVPPI
jgi:hypothetical protein